MTQNPFDVIKAEEFNHGYHQLASLMHFSTGLGGSLLSSSNVFLDGSRGSGKSMYLRLLSVQAKTIYEQLAAEGRVDPLPEHRPFCGIYMKLSPTQFGFHEYEGRPGFADAFRELFNTYAMERITRTVAELDLDDADRIRDRVATLSQCDGRNLDELSLSIREECRALRQKLNHPPYAAGERAQPEVLWDFTEIVTRLRGLEGQRIHLPVDEYDNLTVYQQRILNGYLRKRDYPLTFKIACRKHRLTTRDPEGRALNPSGDYGHVHLDDEDLGLGESFADYVEAIGNRRLTNAGIRRPIRELLGRRPPAPRRKGERRYGGFEEVVVLSSGIVRTFLELCRDVYSRDRESGQWPVKLSVQNAVIKRYAANRWSSLAADQSARPELQRLIEQIARIFKAKAEAGAESQIIRLEIVDFEKATQFLRGLLNDALDYEAWIKPNQERVDRNTGIPSRGYLLHRLLCVHFRLEPESRWDFEITAMNLQGLVTEAVTVQDVVRRPTTRRPGKVRKVRERGRPLLERPCPVLDSVCETREPTSGMGFLATRLPKGGVIRDAIGLLKEAFAAAGPDGTYSIRTAEDYPPVGDIACKVCGATARSEFVLVELSRFSPSVAMELGFCVARGLPTYLLFNEEEQQQIDAPFSSLEYFSYAVTPVGVKELVERQIIPFLHERDSSRTIRLGPRVDEMARKEKDVFVALPDDPYSEKTLLPEVERCLERRGFKGRTHGGGRALQDLHRAAVAIANSEYCLVDTTFGHPVRAMYLGMALGYGRMFANLVNRERDGRAAMFTNAKAKSVFEYEDRAQLVGAIDEFFNRVEGE